MRLDSHASVGMQGSVMRYTPAQPPVHDVQVRRTHVVQDALNQLVYRGAEELKKPLRATFISGGVPEPAQVSLGGRWQMAGSGDRRPGGAASRRRAGPPCPAWARAAPPIAPTAAPCFERRTRAA